MTAAGRSSEEDRRSPRTRFDRSARSLAARSEPRRRTTAAALVPAARSGRARAGETRPSVPTIAVAACAGMAVVALAARPMRLHAGIAAAEVPATTAPLPDRELGQPAFFLLPFDSRKLRTNQRPVHWALFQFDRCVGAHPIALIGARLI